MSNETEEKKDKRIGNQFWLARSSHGAKPKFSDKDVLLKACQEYFQWVEDNPLTKAIVFQGKVCAEGEPYMRPMTIKGLCLFLDICESTWQNYRKVDDLLPVITQVEAAIYDQKFAGASAGFFNANIIARDLGLKDRQEIDVTARELTPWSEVEAGIDK